jgi:hypothetical protein
MPYTLTYGGTADGNFPLQFPQAPVSLLSASVVLIELLSNDGLGTAVSHGTGFMWRDEGRLWLITALHVLSGRNPFDGELLSPDLYEPTNVRVHFGVGQSPNVSRLPCTLPVKDDHGGSLWAIDPQFDELRTDIAALPIDIGRSDVYCVNDDPTFGTHDNLFSHVGFQCFVIGYPTLAVGGFMLPIWRSGSIASDPSVPIDSKPIFLLDAATGPGFSGSPVFRMQIGPAPFHDSTQSTGIRIEGDAVLRSSFAGVYGGRLNHPHMGAQTPYVFYGNRVPIIIEANPLLSPVVPI